MRQGERGERVSSFRLMRRGVEGSDGWSREGEEGEHGLKMGQNERAVQ